MITNDTQVFSVKENTCVLMIPIDFDTRVFMSLRDLIKKYFYGLNKIHCMCIFDSRVIF